TCVKLLDAGRVDFVAEADFRTASRLSRRVELLLDAIIADIAYRREAFQCRLENRGRSWVASVGGSLTFSMLWRFERGAGELGGLSLAAGAAVAGALADCGVPRAQVKWPNDVVVDLR